MCMQSHLPVHPSLVRLLGSGVGRDTAVAVMEYCDGV